MPLGRLTTIFAKLAPEAQSRMEAIDAKPIEPPFGVSRNFVSWIQFLLSKRRRAWPFGCNWRPYLPCPAAVIVPPELLLPAE